VVGGAGVLTGPLGVVGVGWLGCPVGGVEGRERGTGGGVGGPCVGGGLADPKECDEFVGAAWVGSYCMRGAVPPASEGVTEPVALGAGAPGVEESAAGVSPATATAGSAVEPDGPGRTGAICAGVPAAAGVPAPVCITAATAVTAPMPAAPPSSVSAALRIGPGFLCRVATRPHLPICAARSWAADLTVSVLPTAVRARAANPLFP
jgi:hypothetical protein